MGAIKKMVEEELPGIYVLSLMIGKTLKEVLKLNVMMHFRVSFLTFFFSFCLCFNVRKELMQF